MLVLLSLLPKQKMHVSAKQQIKFDRAGFSQITSSRHSETVQRKQSKQLTALSQTQLDCYSTAAGQYIWCKKAYLQVQQERHPGPASELESR